MDKKSALRESLLASRRAIDTELRSQWDAAIAGRVLAWANRQAPQSLGVYWPIRGEPDLRAAYAELARRGVRLSLPVITGKVAPLEFAPWTPGDAMVKDALGVSIPASITSLVKPDALLIPCVGFSPARIRLGYGGGFYDRTLAALPKLHAVGIAYSNALALFDADPHDVGLDLIITELE
ncbi:5-formyltetrahydrofolate cyclo-ligase [soil metagenome]